MSQGAYGINIPANVNINEDIEILYKKSISRNLNDNIEPFQDGMSNGIELQQVEIPNEDNTSNTLVDGLYQLILPSTIFDSKGIYNIYIKPKEISTSIQTIGTLAAYPNVRGIVISTAKLNTQLVQDNGLVGYRIIYLDEDKKKLDYYRVITSSFKVAPVVENLSNSTNTETRYAYDASSNLLFLTVTPSVAPNFKTDATPFIGKPTQQIFLVNTKFNPQLIELELVENDADTLAIITNGTQIRDLDRGLITTFDDNNEIYSQHEMTTLKRTDTGEPIYEVRKKKDTIEGENDYKDILEDYFENN